MSRDITKRKRPEDELRTQKQRFQTLSENAPFGMIMIDQEGHFKYINPKFIELFGYDLKDVANGKEWFRKAYPDPAYRHHVISTWIEDLGNFKPGEKRPRIFTVTCKDGTEKVINFIPVQLGAGENLMACEDITERQRAQEALSESEEKYRTLVEHSLQGIAIGLHTPPRLVFVNPALGKTLGYAPDELTSLSPKETEALIHPEDRIPFFKLFKDRLDGRPMPTHYGFRAICKDGSVRWLEVSTSRVLYGGQPAVQATFVDITERNRAEEALRESEERYRTILENIEDGYYETDLPGDLIFFNDSLCRMLGYSKDEMMGMSNKQYTDQENRNKLFAAFNKVYRTGKPAKGFDWQVFTKDGRKLFGEASVSLIKDSKGQPTGFRGIARDITERKQAEEALRTEKQRFETLLENAPFGVIMIDKEGNFKYVNSKFIELFGYDLNDIPNGKEWFRKAYPDPAFRHHVIETWINDSNISEAGKNVPRIFTATCKDGMKKIIRFITVQLGTGEYLMSCEDITLVQRAEEEKASLAEQLRQSQKIEAIGRLAGGVAHDFNNLLTVIRGYSQLSLMDLKGNEKLRGNLDEIQKATQRASDLTHHLLAFSRRQIMEMKILDLNTLLKDLDKMLHRVIGEDIQLTYRLSDDIGKVRVDPGQMEQVILNLAVNARDAMPSGGKLTIETSNAELDEAYAHAHIGSKPGRYVMMSVSDTGLGMSPEVKERAFEPFFTTKEKGKGTGLGLSTCYGIVKQSGGNIWAYSELGRGTTFKVYLPRVDESPKEEKGEDKAAEIFKGTETILAVEDEIEVRKLVAEILKGQGYTVIEASDGEEAVKVSRENAGKKIHLLLTDVVMPGMSGRELAVTLGLQHPTMKILYMSGYTDNAIVHHGVLEEGVNYIQKPFTLDALARKVREVLDQRG
jgi:two-component system cell cycle sensor histidine kinase/response regulator CckA